MKSERQERERPKMKNANLQQSYFFADRMFFELISSVKIITYSNCSQINLNLHL